MRTTFLILTFFCLATSLFGQSAIITEISYDNNYDQDDPFGIDSIEYVEIYIGGSPPVDPTSWKIVSYDASSSNPANAEVAFVKDLTDAIPIPGSDPGYYVIEFVDSTFFGFPIGGIRDGMDGIALVEIGTPNIVHDFWRYETCDDFTAVDGPAAGAVSKPITQDRSRTCGDPGVSLVQMNSALCTCVTLQQNGFGDWELDTATPGFENPANVPVNLLFFNAVASTKNVQLSWATAQEVSNDYFSILHSTDGRSFNEIGRVIGRGDYNGESNYNFTTEKMSSGQHYFKLKQVDFDGNYEVFPVKSVKIDDEDIIVLYPSLATSEIRLTNVDDGTIFQLFDLQGQLIKEDSYNSTINISDLQSGIFILKVKDTVLKFAKI